ncbi:pH-response regulator protein palF/RIM8 [Cladobotryum mycophilum]|uniref:PH-response regulator protein palF/RIM8 n=1 Tax=Cladobotryum mycophilum TaxID=491253 RepID=A0ABR0SFD2_9HYPO
MPLGASRGNGRLSTPSTSASASASGSSPSLSASATLAAATAGGAPAAASTASNNGGAAGAASTPTASNGTTTTTTDSSSSTTRPAPPTASASISTSSPRSSFLSRLSLPLNLPLRSRTRHLTDFHVRCDEPHKKYVAGDSVRGAVVLVVVKALRLTHLVVTLHGFVRVLKDSAAVTKVQGTTTLPPAVAPRALNTMAMASRASFKMRWSYKGLPSSIDFERGTISYMVTATLTKPTSIAPTISCERKVMLAERINVSLLPPPRPRTIFLEPISKRTRKKKSSMALEKGTAVAPEVNDLASEVESLEQSVTIDDTIRDSQPSDQRSPASCDVQSEVSGESARSISTALSRSDLPQLSQVGTAFTSAQQQAVDDKTITATIELLKGGCLPGDIVSVRVTVQHVKRVKSMTGVVVTLFRQGKIDYSPSSSLFASNISKEDARKLQKDEIYPRSRTGLSGLSLSSAGSVSMFRKDLDQTTAPLIIDPVTLQASITVPVKVPDDSFPTIRGVPGDMIAFKYQVEVIVDLGGRLSGQLQGGHSSRFAFGTSASDHNLNMFSSRRDASIVDTSQLRRQKGVISVSMESIVGTVDSSVSRKHVKVSQSPRTLDMGGSDDDEGLFPTPTRYEEARYNSTHPNEPPPPQGYFPPHTNGQSHYYSSPPPSHQYRPQPASPDYSPPNHYTNGPAPLYVPPPQLPDQNNLSEKDRIRQAETRLLPSQPPGAVAGPAPTPDDDDIYDAQATPRPNHYDAGRSPGDDNAGPSAPPEEELIITDPPAAGSAEDKQERERRRLMEEASAPPDFPEDMERRHETGSAPTLDDLSADAEPTAPVLDDNDDYPGYGSIAGPSGSRSASGQGNQIHGEQLPAYQR